MRRSAEARKQGKKALSQAGGGGHVPSRAGKALRLAVALLVPACFYLVCGFLKVGSLLWIVPAAFVAAAVYALPCLVNVAAIRGGGYASVKPFVAADALCCLLPALCASLVQALFLYLFFDRFRHIFLPALLLCLLFTLTQLCFWLLYCLINAVGRLRRR